MKSYNIWPLGSGSFHLVIYTSFTHVLVYCFYGWITFHCMDISHFVYPLIRWWTCVFYFLAIMHNIAIVICIQLVYRQNLSAVFGKFLGVDLLGLGNSNFLSKCQIIFQSSFSISKFTRAVHEGSTCFTSLPTLVNVHLFYSSNPSGYND